MPLYSVDADDYWLHGEYVVKQTVYLRDHKWEPGFIHGIGPYTTTTDTFKLNLIDPCRTTSFNSHPEFSSTFPGSNKITTSVRYGTDLITSATYPSDPVTQADYDGNVSG